MKKLVAVILSTLLFATCFSVSAKDEQATKIHPQKTLQASLVDSQGCEIKVTGYLLNEETFKATGSQSEQKVTYYYPLYVSKGSGSFTEEGSDGALAATAYLTIYYETQNTPTEYLLTKVSGSWVIHDSSVIYTGATLDYGCVGSFPQHSSEQTGSRSVGNPFSINTGFSKYTTEYGGVLGANLYVNLQIGSSRKWTLHLQNNLFP